MSLKNKCASCKLTLETVLSIVALLALGIVYFVHSQAIAEIEAELADLERLEQMAINAAVLSVRTEKNIRTEESTKEQEREEIRKFQNEQRAKVDDYLMTEGKAEEWEFPKL